MNRLNLTAKRISTLLLSIGLLFSTASWAEQAPEPALLVIGASYSNGNLPLDDDLNGVLGGLNVGLGSYLDLGQALTRDPRLPGYVINEAEAGGSTVAHNDCSLAGGTACGSARWRSFDEQFDRALRRVAHPFFPGVYNAKYVVITLSNDCLHSNSFNVPEVQAVPCDINEMNAFVDRLIALGQRALNVGITPIYDIYPAYEDLNLPLAGAPFAWIMDEASWNQIRTLHYTRISNELPGAVLLDMWTEFDHNGDGIHPDDRTVRKAAAVIANYVTSH